MGTTTTTTEQESERSQQAVLDHYGTDATSRHVRLADPPLDVHVLEVGDGHPSSSCTVEVGWRHSRASAICSPPP